MKLDKVSPNYGHSNDWEHLSDHYFDRLKNKTNMICVYSGVFTCTALVTKKGSVLATKGELYPEEMEYLIRAGYIA